ncbi:MAG: beta-lactamase family protein [Alphaproteobacteria bacterium]|nr:beta-lactamase family protein [Alphaproteobacteria bacterium]
MRPLVLLLLAGCDTPDADADADADTDTDAGSPCHRPLDDEGGLDPALAAALQEVLDTERSRLGAPGATLAVHVPGRGSWVGASGTRDEDQLEPVRSTDGFLYGSITKTFVAALVLQLEDEGLLARTDTVDRWYPDLPQADAITLDLLLQHGSGLVDYTDLPSFLAAVVGQDDSGRPVDDVIAEAGARGLRFPPGTAWSYSNTNYFVLGRVLERLTGEALEDLVRTRLTGPGGLDTIHLSGFDPEPACAPQVAGFNYGVPGWSLDPRWQWASGGLGGDVRDLLRWGRALFDATLVPPAHLALMRDRALFPEEGTTAPAPYGRGMRLEDTPCGFVEGHTGSTNGFQSDLFRTEDGIVVAALHDEFGAEVSDLAYAACVRAREALAP